LTYLGVVQDDGDFVIAVQGGAEALRIESCCDSRCSGSPAGMMKIALNVVGAVLVGFGGTWILHGINVLPGSFHDRADSVGCPRRDCSSCRDRDSWCMLGVDSARR